MMQAPMHQFYLVMKIKTLNNWYPDHKIYLIIKIDHHLKIISQLIFFDTIVVCEFNNKVIIFWSKASHCFTPLAIIRTVSNNYNE